MFSKILLHFDRIKLTFAPRLSVSRCVKLWDDTNASQTGKFNNHLHIRGGVHVCVWVERSLPARRQNTGSADENRATQKKGQNQAPYLLAQLWEGFAHVGKRRIVNNVPVEDVNFVHRHGFLRKQAVNEHI